LPLVWSKYGRAQSRLEAQLRAESGKMAFHTMSPRSSMPCPYRLYPVIKNLDRHRAPYAKRHSCNA
jgi:hypothetical protein